ncbi:HlyD family secretion protein [Dehalobacterium formicoaceticum]|uniref:HlyD family secretion protein n=2 Tax=Dehalobacterium formicoaceticum TaxID=51515 RepID=A0ABT1XZZ0_9FIRM|nr:HlyD family secretion protein [Dehalobacterium formicoaceticum]MCR6544183.1 HlyD family secretion protein [Dehalobacterium formicoaceticum]
MKKCLTVLLLMVSLIGTSCSNGDGETAGGTEETVTSAEPGIEVFGEVVVENTKEIMIDFPAAVEEIYVTEGQTVSKGDPLIRLNFEQYRNEIEQMKKEISLRALEYQSKVGDVSAREKELQRLKNEKSTKSAGLSKGTDPELKRLQAELDRAKQAAADAKNDFEINQELFDAGALPQVELDRSKSAYLEQTQVQESCVQTLAKAKSNLAEELRILDTTIASLETEISQAGKDNQSARDQQSLNEEMLRLRVRSMEEKISKSYFSGNDIISDLDQGVIAQINCVTGNVLGEGNDTSILRIMDMGSIQVVADVPEEFIDEVQLGAQCEITSYHDKLNTFTGKIKKISDLALPQEGEKIIKVYIDVMEGKEALKPGFSVDVKFQGDKS